MSERNFELRPQRVTPAREHDLTQTAFRCGGWSVRGPDTWKSWGLTERLSAVLGISLMAGAAIAGLLVPVVVTMALLRALGVLS